MPFALSTERERETADIFSRYPNKLAACIPLLHLCQEQNGWISDEVIQFVAERCEVSTAHVQGVVTFYTLFNQKPVGKHQIWVCRTLSCALRGSDQIARHLQKKLGVHIGETTKDGLFTLREAECLAACGQGPMMLIDKTYHENLTPEKVDKILDELTGEAK
ncbi:MAG: NADH-quinone oxidoreductase subunit NuoE [Deltaproteobacteria bacterium]|nr:NADH-quinone oxidoreductase subunit NuoE [Deltaproteobacteria bacterium]